MVARDDAPDSRESRTPITEKALLVVEGKDEELFFQALLQHLGLTGVEVRGSQGKTQLPDQLKALLSTSGFPEVLALAIVRDADGNACGAFQSVCSALAGAGLPVPSAELEWTGKNPQVAIMILPGDGQPGQLEDLCLRAVQNDLALPCVERYFDCLRENGISVLKDPSKATVQVFLASKPRAYLRVGEAAQGGYWPFDAPAFTRIREIVEHLSLVAVANALEDRVPPNVD
ncbi:MAG: hypothetical protein FJ026_13745 [Chloroflexi bacterium]|nr:hypothetical protein [Chloroflexota bacterium]